MVFCGRNPQFSHDFVPSNCLCQWCDQPGSGPSNLPTTPANPPPANAPTVLTLYGANSRATLMAPPRSLPIPRVEPSPHVPNIRDLVNDGRNTAIQRDRQTTLTPTGPTPGEIIFSFQVAHNKFPKHFAATDRTEYPEEAEIVVPKGQPFTSYELISYIQRQALDDLRDNEQHQRQWRPNNTAGEWSMAINHLYLPNGKTANPTTLKGWPGRLNIEEIVRKHRSWKGPHRNDPKKPYPATMIYTPFNWRPNHILDEGSDIPNPQPSPTPPPQFIYYPSLSPSRGQTEATATTSTAATSTSAAATSTAATSTAAAEPPPSPPPSATTAHKRQISEAIPSIERATGRGYEVATDDNTNEATNYEDLIEVAERGDGEDAVRGSEDVTSAQGGTQRRSGRQPKPSRRLAAN
jgi:hypothetical protein